MKHEMNLRLYCLSRYAMETSKTQDLAPNASNLSNRNALFLQHLIKIPTKFPISKEAITILTARTAIIFHSF